MRHAPDVNHAGDKPELSDGKSVLAVPFDGSKAPGIRGKLKFLVSDWR